jgi:thiol-disulfide isomerase/thioredoxin
MAKSKSQKSSSAQRAAASQQSSSAAGSSSTQQSSTTQKSTTQSVSGGQKTSAAQRREAQRQQQMANAERNRAKTRNTRSGGSRGRKQASPAVSPIVWVAVTLLVVAAAVGLFFYLSNQPSSSSSSSGTAINGRKAAPAQVVNEVTNVSPSVLQSVDIGQVQATPTPLSGQPPLTGPTGKPEFFYFGAEYCPYCAAQRWSMLVALSRFGTFKNLSITTSSASDVYANTPTFSFYGSSYSSPYVDFVSVETTTNQPNGSGGYVTLETPTAAQEQLVNQYNSQGSIPFVDIANKYIMIGPAYSPQLLQGQNWQQIASALSDPSSKITQGIIGGANYLTAAICMSTNQQPTSVCQAAPIPAIETALNKTSFNAGGPQLSAIGSAPVAYVKRQD